VGYSLHFCPRRYGFSFNKHNVVGFGGKHHKMAIAPFRVIQGYRFLHRSKAFMWLSISESYQLTSHLPLFSKYRELLIKLAGRRDGQTLRNNLCKASRTMLYGCYASHRSYCQYSLIYRYIKLWVWLHEDVSCPGRLFLKWIPMERQLWHQSNGRLWVSSLSSQVAHSPLLQG